MSEPKWKTPPYKVTGWICILLIIEVTIIDIVLACWDKYPTISQYVTARWKEQTAFGIIVLAAMGVLAWHWFFDKSRMK